MNAELLLIGILSPYQVGLLSKVLLNVTYHSGLTTTLLRSLWNRDEAKKAKIHEERWMLNCPICLRVKVSKETVVLRRWG